ncbi:membrane fusion protein, multidrug efflux system [Sphingomonas guangdongensis]|uniref:Membrane fusion protein, multidrug efflux system n=1 Tax=Sphingomonas guangdongensis TaxID=1141890 RepID=A0A285QZY1_9SPHN|nr:HlyD family secretion protein [Sphingomonas guangdongensis]SOB86969.1 membrane fusion protein, multidrug efflux system [Sphingomonas guangdongensis]
MADADPRIDTADARVADAPAPTKRRWLRPLLMFGIPLIVIGVVAYLWATSGRFVSTDNAYVQQDKVSVASDVAGRIVAVNVRENQLVKAGDLLFRIDPDPYRIAVEQANAQIAGAQVSLQTLRATYAGTSADIAAATDQIAAAQEDYQRQSELMKRGFTTRARLEQSQHGLEQARATYQNAVADANEARARLATGAAVPGENPQIAAARVARAKAQLDLSRTEVRAPVSGQISQADRLQVGQMMVTGLPAVTIVADARSWVEANFKETDLARMRVGQPAEVSFDAYPGLHLRGHVQSIGAGTGSEFSVLPAQNANGNWVKVTQRVPVRIAIDEKSPRQLIAGLSADVRVDVRN